MVWVFLEYLILVNLENNDKCQNQLSLRPAMQKVPIVGEADLRISSVKFIPHNYTSQENYLHPTLF